MERLSRQNGLLEILAHGPARFAARVPLKLRSSTPSEVMWWIFATSVTISMLPSLFGEPSGLLAYAVAIGGAAGCGWAWLFARSLFRAENPVVRWNIIAVAGIVVVEAWWHLSSGPTFAGVDGEVRRIAANAASLICVGALMLVFVEALSGYSSRLPKLERRFRQIFCLGFIVVITITLVWAAGTEEGSFAAGSVDAVVTVSAFACLAGARLAISFRRRHPLTTSSRKVPQAVSAAAGDKALAARILHALEQDDLFTTADLKVADLASAMREQEYKVTSCITGYLGYRNFNHLINVRRIDHAKQALAQTQNEGRSILSIALDSGFNSIGPFNRAFKEMTGMTPSAFRGATYEAKR